MTGDPFWQVIAAQGLKVPDVVATLHLASGQRVYRGRCDIDASRNPLARLVRRVAGFPPGGRNVPLTLVCEDMRAGRVWTRDFDGHVTRSVLRYHAGEVVEAFGPFLIRLALAAEGDQLHVRVAGLRAFGLPIPAAFLPRSSTTEGADGMGRFAFDVSATLPLAGCIIRYRGWLEPVG